MVITNSIVVVNNFFESKDEIKKYLYDHILDHPFKKYNLEIAKKYGEHMFSMTFVKPNIVVLTQKYMTMKEYENSLKDKQELIDFLYKKSIITSFMASEPFEVFY